jgi:hypothetical protein
MRPEITGRRPVERLAFSISEFCEAHGFSVDHYFRLSGAWPGRHEGRP